MSTLRTWLADRLRRGRVGRAARLPPLAPSPAAIERAVAWLSRFRLLRPLMEGILPVPRLLKDETVQLEIRMAPYRLRATRVLFTITLVLLILSLVGAVVLSLLPISGLLRTGVWLFPLLSLLGWVKTIRQMLLYYQWRFILTNKRIILIAPEPRRSGFADVIYLKGGKIQVVDTAWSSSSLWGLFQAMTGARDVILSLTGYEFKPEGAEVKGGLRFPDVMPEDIVKLEEIIFS